MAGTVQGARKAIVTKYRRKLDDAERRLALVEANASAAGGGFVSGLKVDLGRIDEEYVPALKTWTSRVDTYQKMGNDAGIAARLRAYILPLISACRWTVEGGEDDARDHVAANLLRQGDPRLWCDTSWTQRLFEAALCLQYGISLFGKTRAVVDGKMIFSSLTYLHPRTLGGPRGPFEWDGSGTRLVAIHRAYKKPDGSQEMDERIPVEDVFPVVWWMAGENWEGVPLIRAMYRPWVEKDLACKIQMIDLQNRGVGIPDFELAPNDGAKEAATAVEIVKSFRGGDKQRQFVVRGAGQKVGFMTSTGTVLDATPIIASKNSEYASGSGTDFQQSGQTQTGSRATSSVLMVNYMQELDATREILQEQFNHGAGNGKGLVEELVDAFTEGGIVEEYPCIVGTKVAPTDQLDNVPNILDAVQKGSLIHDLSVENHVRKALGVAPLTSAEFDKLKSAGERVPNIGGRPDGPRPVDVDDPREDEMSRAFGLQEKKTLPASRPTRNGRSYGWLASSQS